MFGWMRLDWLLNVPWLALEAVSAGLFVSRVSLEYLLVVLWLLLGCLLVVRYG